MACLPAASLRMRTVPDLPVPLKLTWRWRRDRSRRRPRSRRRRGTNSPHHSPFISEAAGAVRERLAASSELEEFLRSAGVLTLDERRLIVEQALVLLEQNYVHLPEKMAMYAVNPVQRLRVLRSRIERQSSDTMPAEWIFHSEVSEVFHSVHDLHTVYLLPEPFAGKVAFLPFLIEEYTDQRGSHYAVTHIAPGFSAPGFERGAEVTHWSGIPIAAAVDLNAARFMRQQRGRTAQPGPGVADDSPAHRSPSPIRGVGDRQLHRCKWHAPGIV